MWARPSCAGSRKAGTFTRHLGSRVLEEFHLPFSLVVVESFRVRGASVAGVIGASFVNSTHTIQVAWPPTPFANPFDSGGPDHRFNVRYDLNNQRAESSDAAKKSPLDRGR